MGFRNDWNVITQFAAFPCAEPNPIIIAVTLLPAAVPALLEYISFGCRDIMKFKLGKGAPCGRALAANLFKAVPPKYVDDLNRILKWEHRFSVAGQIFMIADLEAETIARWTTMAYQLSGCSYALAGAFWQWEYDSPFSLRAGVATVVGGRIINETGTPGISHPTGANAPAGWHTQIEFQVTAIPVFGGQPVSVDIWVREGGAIGFDFPANHYPPGYPGTSQTAHYLTQAQNGKNLGVQQYTMYARSSVDAVCSEMSGSANCTPYSQTEAFLKPLSCLQGGFPEHIDDPQGTNRRARQPNLIAAVTKAIAGGVQRGPPGGKPRSKK